MKSLDALKGLILLGTAIMCCMLGAGAASAAVRASSATFNPNQQGPTFGGPTTLPLITISVSYDDQAGTMTVSETGGDPSYFTGFAQFSDITLTGTNAPDVRISGDWDYPMAPFLGDSAVNGTLTAQSFTKSSDGSTLTAVFSDPALAGQALTFVTIEPSQGSDNNCFCDVPPGGSFYFPGYTPLVTIANPGAQHTQAGTSLGTGSCGGNAGTCCPAPQSGGTPCPGLPLSATEVGLATSVYGDAAGVAANGTTPANISVAGLPPGLRLGTDDEGHTQIMGKPTTPGTYMPTITATAQYNNSTQTATATTSFPWVIATPPPAPKPPKPKPKPAPLPAVAVNDGAGPHGRGLQKRPFTITWTGDGTGVLGGNATGRSRHFGRLHWTSWTTTHAKATGKSWEDNCTPACANGRFFSYPVKVALSRPQHIHGYLIFTRLTITYTHSRPRYLHRRSVTAKLQWGHGEFGWG